MINNAGNIFDFNRANAVDSFNFKTKITDQTGTNNNKGNVAGRADVEIMVPLKYLSNFWRTLEMPLISCELELIFSWSGNCIIIYADIANQVLTFKITETNLHGRVVTLSTRNNVKLLSQLKSSFRRIISWNKYLAKPELLVQNANLNHLIEPNFQGVNRLFVLAVEDDAQRTSDKRYYITNVEIKDYNVTNDRKNFFDQPAQNGKVTYQNIRKIATGRGDDYTTGCLLDYTYFKKYYKMIVIDLSKQQALDADPKAIQQVNLTTNLDRARNTRLFFIHEEAKQTVFEFSQGTVKVL